MVKKAYKAKKRVKTANSSSSSLNNNNNVYSVSYNNFSNKDQITSIAGATNKEAITFKDSNTISDTITNNNIDSGGSGHDNNIIESSDNNSYDLYTTKDIIIGKDVITLYRWYAYNLVYYTLLVGNKII